MVSWAASSSCNTGRTPHGEYRAFSEDETSGILEEVFLIQMFWAEMSNGRIASLELQHRISDQESQMKNWLTGGHFRDDPLGVLRSKRYPVN